MTPQTVTASTVIRHFGYIGANGEQTDIVLTRKSDDSNEHIQQIQGAKFTDLTGRIPAGKSAAQMYADCLAMVQGKSSQVVEFVGGAK